MKIFGHPWIESEKFYAITSIEEIATTPANTLLRLDALEKSLKIAKHCQKNALRYTLKVNAYSSKLFI